MLKEHLQPIVGIDKGYTKCHFFEFADGEVAIRNIVTDLSPTVHKYVPTGMVRVIRDAMLKKVIGLTPLEKCTFKDIILERHPVSTFPATKISSLS